MIIDKNVIFLIPVPLKASSSKPMHFCHLLHAKSIHNLKTYLIYLNLDTCYANSSILKKSCKVSTSVLNRIRNLDFFLFEHTLWTKGQLWVPQTWTSVNPLHHQMAYKSVPLHFTCPISLDSTVFVIDTGVQKI